MLHSKKSLSSITASAITSTSERTVRPSMPNGLALQLSAVNCRHFAVLSDYWRPALRIPSTNFAIGPDV